MSEIIVVRANREHEKYAQEISDLIYKKTKKKIRDWHNVHLTISFQK